MSEDTERSRKAIEDVTKIKTQNTTTYYVELNLICCATSASNSEAQNEEHHPNSIQKAKTNKATASEISPSRDLSAKFIAAGVHERVLLFAILLMSWDILLNPLPSTVSGADDPSLAPLALSVAHNVQINRQTIVSELFHYAPSTRVEYPKTASNNNAIGHLFDMDLSKEWVSPA
ncbi:hypothetical protein BT96DRAFT_933224 [Gymnopus androsaceus JB14]|uniref:Uncharacterized protein n=1 Tax=Gymnopus androsaceus JB14 TaxID=1447944 RepID=A0A6A4IEX4_9AGAR|nr:hypothetical protein BT96DRAFT_933224 [Gymnopus androsaceus JB14]